MAHRSDPRWRRVAASIPLGLTLVSCSATPATSQRLDAHIVESSGIVASRVHEGVLWNHSDSERAPTIFATRTDGTLLASFTLDATNVDWEDIATDDEGNLYVADIGDNKEERDDLVVYQITEPDPETTAPDALVDVRKSIRFRYPEPLPEGETSRDAEALFWWRDRLYLLTKRWSDAETILFRFPALGDIGEDPVVLERVSSFSLGGPSLIGGMATAADVDPAQRMLALLSYHAIFLFELGDDPDALATLVKTIPLRSSVTRQCEAITWVGSALVFSNEGGRLYRIDDPMSPDVTQFPPADQP